jgi:hypothetical protein
MGQRMLLGIAGATLVALGIGPVAAQTAAGQEPLEARLWLGGGEEPVVRRGERVRIRYRTSEDAYAAVFRIDTDGWVHLVSPSHPGDVGFVRGGRDHQLVLARSPFWMVADDPGVGYMFLVVSPEPFDFSAFGYHPASGWDVSAVGSVVYDDPYVAMDDFIMAILPGWQEMPYALDFATYHVDEPRSYPRFLCYDCHTYRTFAEWNPYQTVCSTYRVVIYDDPYFHPAYRYAGTRVVFPRPIPDRPRYDVAERRPTEAWAPIVRVRSAPAPRVAYKEAPDRRASADAPARVNGVSSGRIVPARPGAAPSARASRADVRRSRVDRPITTGIRGTTAASRRAAAAAGAAEAETDARRTERAATTRGVPRGGDRGRAAPGPPSAGVRPAGPERRTQPAAADRARPVPRPAAAPRSGARDGEPPRGARPARAAPSSREARPSSGGASTRGAQPPRGTRPAQGVRPPRGGASARPSGSARPSARSTPGRQPAAATRPGGPPGPI